MSMVTCNDTTWVPYVHMFAVNCHQLRLMYFRYGLEGGGHGLGGRNCATIYYRRVVGGNLCHVTNSSESGIGAARHSERVCYDEMLSREGGMPPVIELVYSERFPCGPQNMNCLAFLNAVMPAGTPVFWSFDWPDASDLGGRLKRKHEDDGDDPKREASRRRAEGTRDLKLYHRDLDYKGSAGGGDDSVTVVGEADQRVATTLRAFRDEKKLANPFPVSGALV
jgi:hypothetical protein